MNTNDVKEIFRRALSTHFGAPITEYDWGQLANEITLATTPAALTGRIRGLEHDVDVFKGRLLTTESERAQLQHRNDNQAAMIFDLRKELSEAREELRILKPPESRFRIGQVVHSIEGKSAGKITKRVYKPVNDSFHQAGWLYMLENHSCSWHESKLRALTDEEK